MKRSIIKSIGLSLVYLSIQTLHAEVEIGSPSTSAGIIERQIQREFNLNTLSPEKELPVLEVDVPQEVLEIPAGISAYVKKINIQKHFPLFDEEISKIVAPFEDRELSGSDLMDLCEQIEKLYLTQGYILAWVYPPVQTLVDHVLTISILEGVLFHIEVEGNVSYKTRYILKFFDHLQGQPVRYDDLMKALLLVNENTDLSVEGILRKGREVGGVDLVLRVQDKRPATISAGYNNWGSSVTTFNQLSSYMNFGNLATSGDHLMLMSSVGAPAVFYYFNPIYSLPLNGSGARMDLSYLFSHSNTQGDSELEDLNLASWTQTASLTYRQPLTRSRNLSTDLFVSFAYQQFKNLQDGATTSYDKLPLLSVGGAIDYVDSVRGRNVVNATFNTGIPKILGGSKAVDPLSSREDAGARYFILNMNFQRVQPLLTDCMLLFTGTAQGTFNKIPTSIQYILGGMGTVRGYTSAIAVGDVGYCANVEFYIPPPFFKNKVFKPMKKTWGEVMQLLAFVDHGGIYTVDAVESELSPAYLTSVGAGLRFYGPRNLNISFDAGFPVMHQYKEFSSILYVRLNMDFL